MKSCLIFSYLLHWYSAFILSFFMHNNDKKDENNIYCNVYGLEIFPFDIFVNVKHVFKFNLLFLTLHLLPHSLLIDSTSLHFLIFLLTSTAGKKVSCVPCVLFWNLGLSCVVVRRMLWLEIMNIVILDHVYVLVLGQNKAPPSSGLPRKCRASWKTLHTPPPILQHSPLAHIWRASCYFSRRTFWTCQECWGPPE